jgi:predicted unusual protein kinase regulating ubiquinone biosynthesis (AarF/ABC1/UbiB family)
MADLPRRAVTRTARLAGLPLGYAGRTALGVGKRLGGKPAEAVMTEVQQRTAEQLFRTLGELKGGAMKFGQALSIMEGALPEDVAAPYRQHLTRLQDSAPPMSSAVVHQQLVRELGAGWKRKLVAFDDVPAAAASIGQVHRAVWRDGRTVAVKVQYPGAGQALMADFTQLSRLARLFSRLSPGIEMKPLLAELRERVQEELDYSLEADAQRRFAAAYADDPDIAIPRVVASAPKAIISEWLEGKPLSRIIADGTQDERDHAGYRLALLHFSAPARARLLHADPHPGNFRICGDGRLGVLDFGAVARLPEGMPAPLGRMTRFALENNHSALLDEMRRFNFVRPGVEVDEQQVINYLRPVVEPLLYDEFTFNRDWLRREAARMGDPRNAEAQVGRMLNLPPSYVLIHRVTLGSIAVLCQLGARAPFRALAEKWQPGFAED